MIYWKGNYTVETAEVLVLHFNDFLRFYLFYFITDQTDHFGLMVTKY